MPEKFTNKRAFCALGGLLQYLGPQSYPTSTDATVLAGWHPAEEGTVPEAFSQGKGTLVPLCRVFTAAASVVKSQIGLGPKLALKAGLSSAV